MTETCPAWYSVTGFSRSRCILNPGHNGMHMTGSGVSFATEDDAEVVDRPDDAEPGEMIGGFASPRGDEVDLPEPEPDDAIAKISNDLAAETLGPPEPKPPTAKYRYTLTITGNSHDDIERELVLATRGGYLLDSDYYKRDEFLVYGGTMTSKLEHTNPSQTAERYAVELDEWWKARKAARRDGDD